MNMNKSFKPSLQGK